MKARVLVVDDNEQNRFLLRSKMEADGYEVETASDGVEALERAAVVHPDIMLLDVMMPRMDGYEVCKRLKSEEKTRYIPVILLTAKDTLGDKVMGFELGAEDYITKPYSMAEVSARVKSLLKMRALQTRLRDSEKMAALGEMVNGVAHEVRNPLVTIGGMARRLSEHGTDEEQKRYCGEIIKSVERMERMMQRLDEYKDILASKPSASDINDVIAGAVVAAKDLAGGKAVEFKTSLKAGRSLMEVDAANMKLAVFNILQNAVEAIEEKGVVEISTSLPGDDTLMLTITDTGLGMDEEDIRNVFSPFKTSKMTGAGLGLTISYRIITDHGGDIAVESAKGKGTTVTISLPVSASSSASAPDPPFRPLRP